MHDSSFGKEVFILGATLSGEISVGDWQAILPGLLHVTDLKESHPSQAFDYGELGFLHMQPIIDSFIILDAWPGHKGAYLHVCSCKAFSYEKVIDLLKLKYRVIDSFQKRMTL